MGRSSLLKMLSEKANEDRQINEFPFPYDETATPHRHRFNFDELTRKTCENNIESLKTSLHICKVIILGDVSVGKTSIVKRFCKNYFDNGYKATIGVDFEVERFDVLNVPFNLQIWDTAGQERFKCIAKSYYRDAQVIIVVFDTSSIYTLNACKCWLEEALKAQETDPLVFLVGTKKDLLSEAAFSMVEKQAIKIAQKLNAEYWAVSSKNNENITRLFFRIATLAFERTIEKSSLKSTKNFGSNIHAIEVGREPRKKTSCGEFKCT